jgi:hypothetical protein
MQTLREDELKSGEEGLARFGSLPEPRFELLFKMLLEVAEPDQIGQTHAGNRRVIGVSGGVFEGSGLKGRVLRAAATGSSSGATACLSKT